MGQSTNAMIVYGYHFGSDEGWLLAESAEAETNPYGYLKTEWWGGEAEEENEDEDDETGVIARMTRRLFDSIPDAPEVRWSWQHADAVKERLGIWFESHCSGEYPMWILATYEKTACRGDADLIDFDALKAQRDAEGWDAKLAAALEVLAVHPLQEQPGFILASYWG